MIQKEKKEKKASTSNGGYLECSVLMIPKLVHCNGCNRDIMSIDGCPDCGTTRYLTTDLNQ